MREDNPAESTAEPARGRAARTFRSRRQATAYVAACGGVSVVFALFAYLIVSEATLSPVAIGLLGVPAAASILTVRYLPQAADGESLSPSDALTAALAMIGVASPWCDRLGYAVYVVPVLALIAAYGTGAAMGSGR